jgi:hypothetical protein
MFAFTIMLELKKNSLPEHCYLCNLAEAQPDALDRGWTMTVVPMLVASCVRFFVGCSRIIEF